jgi:transposase
MKDNETRQKFIELRAQGMSYQKIASELNVSKQTLINWSQAFQHEINNLRAIQLEALQEQYCLTKEKKIELLGNILNTLKVEAEKRDLTKLSERELLDLILKYSERLGKEGMSILFRQTTDIGDFDLSDLTPVKSWNG